MRRLSVGAVICIGGALVVAGFPAPAACQYQITRQSHASRAAEMRRQHEIRAAIMKREHERRVQEMKRDYERRLEDKKNGRRDPGQSASSSRSYTNATSKKKHSTFNAHFAAPPEDRIASFVSTARSATSLNEILPYLTQAKRNYYQRLEDPQGRRDALDRYKQIAKKVRKITSAHYDGDRATVQVTIRINDTINGKKYTKSTATFGLIGEGYDWRFETFEEGMLATR